MAATLLVYWPALRNGFVWDDTALVLRDPLIRSWRLIPEGFRHFLFLDATASNFYRPIQRLSFVFDYQVYGFGQPWGWHLTSILVHAGAAVALFFTAEKLLTATQMADSTRRWIAFGVAVLWAIHPLHTSAVTYIAGRADPLAALFGFTGLALGLASLEAHRRSALWTLGAAASFFLAMLSKESGIIFLPIWLVLLAWRRETRRRLISWIGIAVVLVAAYSGSRFTSEKVAPPPAPPTPAAIRPILAARAFAEYTALLVAPVTLRMERDVSTQPLDNPETTLREARMREYETLAGVLLLIGFGAWMRFCFRRRLSTAAFCLTAFLIAYLPISNLFSLNATLAEHWLYVPSAFLFLGTLLSAHAAIESRRTPFSPLLGTSLAALAACWVSLLGWRTLLRQADWRDQRTFIERTIAAGGRSPRMLMNLANVEFNAGHPELAVALYHDALRRTPDQPIIWLGLASVLLRGHDFPGAHAALDRAEKSPMLAADCVQLRAALENAESGRDPGDLLRQAIALAPDNWGLRKRYIEYLHDHGAPQEALRELQSFLKQHDFRAESWRLFGILLQDEHQLAPAIQAYEEAAARDVHDEESRAAVHRLEAHGDGRSASVPKQASHPELAEGSPISEGSGGAEHPHTAEPQAPHQFPPREIGGPSLRIAQDDRFFWGASRSLRAPSPHRTLLLRSAPGDGATAGHRRFDEYLKSLRIART